MMIYNPPLWNEKRQQYESESDVRLQRRSYARESYAKRVETHSRLGLDQPRQDLRKLRGVFK